MRSPRNLEYIPAGLVASFLLSWCGKKLHRITKGPQPVKILPLLFLSILLWWSVALASEAPSAPPPLRVRLIVSADDHLASAVTQTLHRELYGLGDVLLVTDQPQWDLRVHAVTARLDGSSTSLVLSYLVSTVEPATILQHFLASLTDQLVARGGLNRFQLAYLQSHGAIAAGSPAAAPPRTHVEQLAVLVGTPHDLTTLCAKLVAQFNRHYLVPHRAARDAFRHEVLPPAAENVPTATTAAELWKTLRQNHHAYFHLLHPDYRHVQEQLQAAGFYVCPVDGRWNTATEAALSQYQRTYGLPITGSLWGAWDTATRQVFGLPEPQHSP